MKKIISLVLAMMLVLTMGAVAFADDVVYTPTEATSFTIKKTYDSENQVVVNETLKFKVEADDDNPSDVTLTVGTNNEVAISALETVITVTVPSYSKAGVYKYTISEIAGSTPGVEYTDSVIKVQVLVEYDNDNYKLVIGNPKDADTGITYYIEKIDGKKADTFENTFKSGSFTVAKDVEGNMSRLDDEFSISVILTSANKPGTKMTVAGDVIGPDAWEYNSESNVWQYSCVKNYSEIGGSKTFSDIPVGVSVKVFETDTANINDYGFVRIECGDSKAKVNGNSAELTIADDTNADFVVVNKKESTIITGISTDSLPYIVLIGVVALVGAAMIIRRRAYNG